MEKKRGAKESSNERGAKRKLVLEHSEGHVFEYSVDEGKSQMKLVNVHVDVKETATVEPSENKIMKINMRVMKTIPLEVMESDTIRKLKANFSKTEGVSMMNLKKLFFGANSLDSDKKLVDYDIKEGSTLNLFFHSGAKIQIYVRLSQSSKTITLEVDTMDTICNVKAKILSKEGITANQHDLIYLGEELDDSQTLASYNIEAGSILYAVFRFGDAMQISVSIEQDIRTINLKVKTWYTIRNVKNVIESMEGIEADRQRLYFGDVKLENDANLADLIIPPGQTLNLIYGMHIFVKSLVGKKLELEVLSSNTGNDVKEMIHQLEGIPPKQQRLIFNGWFFEDSRTLGNYNVEDGSTIHLVPCLCGC